MNEKNNVLVIFYVIIVPRQQKNILRHNDRFIENGKSLSSNIFRKVVLNHKYQKNIHVAFINSVWFLADCRKIIKDVLSLDLSVVYSHQTSYFSSYEITRDLCSAHHIPETPGRDDIDLWVNRHHRRCVDPRQNPIRLNWNYRAWKSISQRLTPYLSFKVTSQHTPHFKR